jgi:DNA helicase-2/ATP-dependent DNA helicase PcrA
MLVVETEVFRGRAASQRVMDLATILPHALRSPERDLTGDVAKLAAATNVFVGITRPRHFLGLAMRKAAATPGLLSAASAQQSSIIDLTDEANQVEYSGGTMAIDQQFSSGNSVGGPNARYAP